MDKNEKNGHEIDDTTRPIDGVCVRQCDHLESDDASEKENFGDEAKANPSETVQSSVDNEESDGTFHAGNQSNSASKKAGLVEQFRTDQQVCNAVVEVGGSEANPNQTDEQVNVHRFSNTQQEEERIRRLYNEQMNMLLSLELSPAKLKQLSPLESVGLRQNNVQDDDTFEREEDSNAEQSNKKTPSQFFKQMQALPLHHARNSGTTSRQSTKKVTRHEGKFHIRCQSPPNYHQATSDYNVGEHYSPCISFRESSASGQIKMVNREGVEFLHSPNFETYLPVDQDGYDYSFSATAAENSNSRLRQREDPPANSNPSKYYKALNTDDRRSMPSVDRCQPVTDIHRQSLPIEHHKLTRVSGQPLLDTSTESHSHSSSNFVFRPCVEFMTTHIPPDVYHIRVAGTDHYFAEMGNYLALISDGAAAPKKAQLRVEYADDGIISLFSLNLGVYLCRDEDELDTAGGGPNADFCRLIFGLAEEKRGRKVAKFELFTVEPHSIVALRGVDTLYTHLVARNSKAGEAPLIIGCTDQLMHIGDGGGDHHGTFVHSPDFKVQFELAAECAGDAVDDDG